MNKIRAATLFALLLLITLPPAAGARQAGTPAASTGCTARKNAPAPARARWHPGVDAALYYRAGDFTPEERRAFGRAVGDWQATLERLGLRFRLSERGEAGADAGEGMILVKREGGMRSDHWGELRAAASREGYMTAAVIAVAEGQRDVATLRRVLAHELGHAFGLDDCPSCGRGETVMSLFRQTKVNGISLGRVFGGLLDRRAEAPTRCDALAATEGYARGAAAGGELSLGAPLGDHDDREGAGYEAEQWERLDPRRLDTSAPETGEGRALIEAAAAAATAAQGDGAEAALAARLVARERETVAALKGYAFTREVLIETLDASGRVTGEYRRVSRMTLADDGARVEKIISFPRPTLKRLRITREDVEDLAGTQMLALDAASGGRYRVTFAGRGEVEGRRCLIFRVTPSDLARAKADGVRVFHGTVWADEETLEVVMARGRSLPEGNQRFPAFEVRRVPVGAESPRHMFPATASGEDTLVFPSVSIRMRLSVRFKDFRKFVSDVKVIEEDEEGDVGEEAGGGAR